MRSGLAILDRIRLERPPPAARPRPPSRDHELGAALARGIPAVEVPGVLVLLFATPLWYANAVHFRDEVAAALARAPGTRVLVLDTIGMSDVDFTGSRALGHVLRACEREHVRVRRGPGGGPRARDAPSQRSGSAHR